MRSKLTGVGNSIFSEMTLAATTHGALNLAQGFPEFGPPDRLRLALAESMHLPVHQYAPMPGLLSLRSGVSNDFSGHPDPVSEVTIVPGATVGIFVAIQAFVHPGDEVVLLEPAYDSYAPAVRLAGGIPVPVPLAFDPLTGFSVDFDRLQSAFSSKTRAILVNTPHNPTGIVWSAADWQKLALIWPSDNALLLSDEVYYTMVFDGSSHVSAWSVEALRHRALVFTSFGKTFHATGWKMGAVIASDALTQEFRKVYQFVAFSAHTPSQHAFSVMFTEHPQFSSTLAAFYEKKRQILLDALHGTGCRALPCAGAYFVVVDTSDWLETDNDRSLAHRMTESAKVASVPLSPFFSSPFSGRLLRLCFAKEDATLREAGERIRMWRNTH